MQSFSDTLRDHPQAKQLMENQNAVRQVLASPETRKLLQSLQKKSAGQLQSAAQAALVGDPSARNPVVRARAADPQAKQAMDRLEGALQK